MPKSAKKVIALYSSFKFLTVRPASRMGSDNNILTGPTEAEQSQVRQSGLCMAICH